MSLPERAGEHKSQQAAAVRLWLRVRDTLSPKLAERSWVVSRVVVSRAVESRAVVSSAEMSSAEVSCAEREGLPSKEKGDKLFQVEKGKRCGAYFAYLAFSTRVPFGLGLGLGRGHGIRIELCLWLWLWHGAGGFNIGKRSFESCTITSVSTTTGILYYQPSTGTLYYTATLTRAGLLSLL